MNKQDIFVNFVKFVLLKNLMCFGIVIEKNHHRLPCLSTELSKLCAKPIRTIK
jgi:hypothetical protein